jgi:hypothetical protein
MSLQYSKGYYYFVSMWGGVGLIFQIYSIHVRYNIL